MAHNYKRGHQEKKWEINCTEKPTQRKHYSSFIFLHRSRLSRNSSLPMDSETSSFETSEMLATFLASTPLLWESWRLCSIVNTTASLSFLTDQAEEIGYVAFSAVQMIPGSESSCRNLVPLESAGNGLFSPLYRHGDAEDPAMVHGGMLDLFLSMYHCPNFQNQMVALMEKSKSIVITGHSIGGALASLAALWLLSFLQSVSSPLQVLCFTFGSPLLINGSLSRAIVRERWAANFCHVVSKHDIIPRLLFAPVDLFTPHLHVLLHFFHLSMRSPHFANLAPQLPDQHKAEIFRFVLAYMEALLQPQLTEGMSINTVFSPFGSYLFCSQDGAICLDNATSVIKMMYLMLVTASPTSSIQDHLQYGDYVGLVSSQFLKSRSFAGGDLPESSYDAGIALALESSGIASQEAVARAAKECLKTARRMGRPPNLILNSANLAIKMSKVTPYRAEIEWYKACCDASDDQMGYYDSFKLREASKRDSRVNMNRHKLASFWDRLIQMWQNNELPYDFHRREKWVYASQFYKLLVEPLDIAEYYRTQMHRVKGHYMAYGRARRYEIFDRWWKERQVTLEENNVRSNFASLTQDSCFWAKLEEAREWLDSVRSERDAMRRALLLENIYQFERYATGLVESKEVSIDVLAKNSSYSLWVEEWKEFKRQVQQFPPHFPSFVGGEVVP